MSINQNNFDIVTDLLRNNVFVIPTFQRPYSWDEDAQLKDLFEDVKHASTKDIVDHYMSPLHVIKIKSEQQSEWDAYVDQSNPDLRELTSSKFTDARGFIINVLLVVDGQQRLTTLFILLALQFGFEEFSVKLRSGPSIPRIILNPPADHDYFRSRLGFPQTEIGTEYRSPSSRSQDRIDRILNRCEVHRRSLDAKEISLLQNGLKTLLIELDAHYALRGFLTLNDRGKPLTHFEKLKSLLMEYDLDLKTYSEPKLIHNTLGKAYQAMDAVYPPLRPTNQRRALADDNGLLALLSLDVWREVNEPLNEGPAGNFSRFRKDDPTSKPPNEGRETLDGWLSKLHGFSESILDLNQRLNGQILPAQFYFPKLGRTVIDHYSVVLDGLGLSRLSLAFVLKFRSSYQSELHTKTYTFPINNSDVIDLLNSELNSIIGAFRDYDVPAMTHLLPWAKRLRDNLDAKRRTYERELSALDVAEWIELFWVKGQSGRDHATLWSGTFTSTRRDADALANWALASINYNKRMNFFNRLMSDQIGSATETVKFVLSEYKSMLRANSVDALSINSVPPLVYREDLNVEHFLPKAKDAIQFPFNGFNDADYYKFVNSLGNLLLLDSRLNSALQQREPRIKVQSYESGHHSNTNAAVRPMQSLELVSKFREIIYSTDYLKYAFQLRKLEIMLFVIDRFRKLKCSK